MPVYIVQGIADDDTRPSRAADSWRAIAAPDKGFVPIADAGHFAVVTHAAEFLTILSDLVARLENVGR